MNSITASGTKFEVQKGGRHPRLKFKCQKFTRVRVSAFECEFFTFSVKLFSGSFHGTVTPWPAVYTSDGWRGNFYTRMVRNLYELRNTKLLVDDSRPPDRLSYHPSGRRFMLCLIQWQVKLISPTAPSSALHLPSGTLWKLRCR